MLERISSCEMRTLKNYKLLIWAILIPIILNGFVFLFNNFLIKAEVSKFFFGPERIPASVAVTIFYISSISFALLFWLYFLSIKRVVSFYSFGTVIDIHLKILDVDDRETMISRVEQAKDRRLLFIYKNQ
jgi:uncharacterized membrane protein YGL010W